MRRYDIHTTHDIQHITDIETCRLNLPRVNLIWVNVISLDSFQKYAVLTHKKGIFKVIKYSNSFPVGGGWLPIWPMRDSDMEIW